MSEPTVSVILPVYNGENYLRFAIDSVLNQTFRDFELIVIDDGSTDTTPDIVRGYGDRLRYAYQTNTGVAGAFNHGLRLATGRYISWLSHDDLFDPTKLEKQTHALARFASPAVCYTNIKIIDGGGQVVSEHELPEYGSGEALRHIVTGGPICSACYSLMYDRKCIETVGMYSEELKYTQDVDMLSRLARCFPLVHVPEFIMQVREHQTRAIHTTAWRREVPVFFRRRLAQMSFEELFPERGRAATPSQKAEGYRWLGDMLSTRQHPISSIAFSQYLRALREDPFAALVVLRRIARLMWVQLRETTSSARERHT